MEYYQEILNIKKKLKGFRKIIPFFKILLILGFLFLYVGVLGFAVVPY